MNSSGMAFLDIATLSFMYYVFFGGWLLTAVGGALALGLPGVRFKLVALSIGAPVAYMVFLFIGGVFHSGTSETLEAVLMTGSVISVLLGPAVAGFLLVMKSRRRPPGNGVHAAS